jgi:hypothetical protein
MMLMLVHGFIPHHHHVSGDVITFHYAAGYHTGSDHHGHDAGETHDENDLSHLLSHHSQLSDDYRPLKRQVLIPQLIDALPVITILTYIQDPQPDHAQTLNTFRNSIYTSPVHPAFSLRGPPVVVNQI